MVLLDLIMKSNDSFGILCGSNGGLMVDMISWWFIGFDGNLKDLMAIQWGFNEIQWDLMGV